MDTKQFLKQIDQDRIVKTIQHAESLSSAEIRVFVTRRQVADPVAAGKQRFQKMGMHKTALRNGVLIFVAPVSQAFSILGDEAIHGRCGDEFWQKVAGAMTHHFQQGQFTDAIEHGINEAGRLLAEHFPRSKDDVNELPDEVGHD